MSERNALQPQSSTGVPSALTNPNRRPPSQPQNPNSYPPQPSGAYQNSPSYASAPHLPPPPPQAETPSAVIWRGPISWTIGGDAVTPKKEIVVYCQASPLQSSAIRDLFVLVLPSYPPLAHPFRRSAEVQFPTAWRIAGLVPMQMSTLQDLANKHTLPAVQIKPIPNEQLPKELREKQSAAGGGSGNEELYGMFAKSMEHRGSVRCFSLVLPSCGR